MGQFSEVTMLRDGWPWFDSRQGRDFYLFITVS